jgi:hypothetical protein
MINMYVGGAQNLISDLFKFSKRYTYDTMTRYMIC